MEKVIWRQRKTIVKFAHAKEIQRKKTKIKMAGSLEQTFFWVFPNEVALLIPQFETSIFQNYEWINLYTISTEKHFKLVLQNSGFVNQSKLYFTTRISHQI